MEPLKILTISRTHFKPDYGIFSVIDIDSVLICCGLENYKSRVARGEYPGIPSYYNAGKYPAWEIIVPNRTHILIHKGNWQQDSMGCVLIGRNFNDSFKQEGIEDSKWGYEKLMDRLKDEKNIKVVIREWYQPC